MFANPAVEANVQTLAQRGFHLLDPGVGPLASGAVGRGRMPEPAELVAAVAAHFSGDLDGLKLLVTAGPTVRTSIRCALSPIARRARWATR